MKIDQYAKKFGFLPTMFWLQLLKFEISQQRSLKVLVVFGVMYYACRAPERLSFPTSRIIIKLPAITENKCA